jgi:hypothetical protein
LVVPPRAGFDILDGIFETKEAVTKKNGEKMMKWWLLIVCACCCAGAQAAGEEPTLLSPFGVEADFQIRSAYHSRMRVSEDRPIAATEVRLNADVGPLGEVGVMNWNCSSLCNRYADVHRRAFCEVDYAVFWKYDLSLSDGVTLSSEFMHWWITLPQNIEPYKGKEDRSLYELWYVGALKNPYLVPSVLIRRGWVNANWVYFRYGVSRSFTVFDFGTEASPRPLTVTPGFFVETGSQALYEARFGKKSSGRRYHTGIGSCLAQVSVDWHATENVSFMARVEQFDLVSNDARDGVHGRQRRDYTMFRLGVRFVF